jgi:hypothetical protein
MPQSLIVKEKIMFVFLMLALTLCLAACCVTMAGVLVYEMFFDKPLRIASREAAQVARPVRDIKRAA